MKKLNDELKIKLIVVLELAACELEVFLNDGKQTIPLMPEWKQERITDLKNRLKSLQDEVGELESSDKIPSEWVKEVYYDVSTTNK